MDNARGRASLAEIRRAPDRARRSGPRRVYHRWRNAPRAYWPVTLAAALLVGLLAYGLTTTGTDTTLDAAVAKGERPAPPAETALPRLGEDGTGSLADYKGKVVLVNVWASWCDPCVDELPLVQKTHEMMPAQGRHGPRDRRQGEHRRRARGRRRVRPHLSRTCATATATSSASGARPAIPENFVIDRDGRIAAVRRFPITQEWVDETLAPMLDEEA